MTQKSNRKSMLFIIIVKYVPNGKSFIKSFSAQASQNSAIANKNSLLMGFLKTFENKFWFITYQNIIQSCVQMISSKKQTFKNQMQVKCKLIFNESQPAGNLGWLVFGLYYYAIWNYMGTKFMTLTVLMNCINKEKIINNCPPKS